MAISVFDLFTIGIGPSSSHTVGPMRAARSFALELKRDGGLSHTRSVKIELFGSLGLTGKGHGTDTAVALGLEGAAPESIDPDTLPARMDAIRASGTLHLLGERAIEFATAKHLVFHRRRRLPLHPNGLRCRAFDDQGRELANHTYYSVGGGFVVDETSAEQDGLEKDDANLPHPFSTGRELLDICRTTHRPVSEIMMANETAGRPRREVRARLLEIWRAMQACVQRGCTREGDLPGPLGVRRRAPAMLQELTRRPETSLRDPLTILDWVDLYALAVNEENAAGGRVVTAPTNGAAGIVPAVLHYYDRFCPGASPAGVVRFLLCAGAIGILYKKNASISGAEVGCQGEVGVACSMAAGALTEVLGGTPEQVENGAEIGMEHNLGLTCDPVGGLVQIPCIERNAMGAVKAINAARMALRGDGRHFVSLDKVIATMRQTGADMKAKYKETALGGLAVNVVAC